MMIRKRMTPSFIVNYLSGYIRLLLLLITATSAQAQLQRFPLSSVRITGGPFYEAQQADMKYILSLDADRLLAPFLIDAGIEPHQERYGNWEDTGLDGHIGGHYLSALSYMYAATNNPELLQRLNYMVHRIAECQAKNRNGYVGGIPGGQETWKQINEGMINAASFSLNGKWVPLYNIHKLYAGLRDAYLIAGNEEARDVLVKLTDWFLNLTANLNDEQIQTMLRSEHGGLNEVFADVSQMTGDKKYLTLAEKFSHRAILDPLIINKDQLTGIHANTQIPKVIGYERVGELTHNKAWTGAAGFFWETVVTHRTVSIGGNSVREHFNPADNFTSMIESNQGPETCNTYNMLRLTTLLYLANPQAKYMDYYERAMYNHILSSQHPDQGGFVYFTPMRPRHYRVYSQPQLAFWCCVGSGLENHGKYGELIYAHNEKDIYVNMFIPSTLTWKEKDITLTQQTGFPYEEQSQLNLTLQKPQKFAVNIRYPAWVTAGKLTISINGKEQKVTATPDGFVKIERKWKNGDVITVSLPMHTTTEQLPDGSPWTSIIHGPLVLAAVTGTDDLDGLWADGSRMGHVASGKFYAIDEAPVMIKNDHAIAENIMPVENQPLTFSAAEVIFPASYKDLKLIPFYKVHDARYMIYWPVMTTEDYEKKKQEIQEREKEMLALEARTVDQVAPGEQQPESDHNFKGEKTGTGINDGHFWRDARGWFSYDLRNKDRNGIIIRITYFGGDKGRTFDILLNDTPFKTVTLEGSQGQKFYDVEYPIPADVLTTMKSDVLNIRFVAHAGSTAGGIYYIRLVTE